MTETTYRILRPHEHARLDEGSFGMPGLVALESIGPFTETTTSGPILTVHDSGESAGLLWYTMPVVDGESLRQRIRRERQLPMEEAVPIGDIFCTLTGNIHVILGGKDKGSDYSVNGKASVEDFQISNF